MRLCQAQCSAHLAAVCELVRRQHIRVIDLQPGMPFAIRNTDVENSLDGNILAPTDTQVHVSKQSTANEFSRHFEFDLNANQVFGGRLNHCAGADVDCDGRLINAARNDGTGDRLLVERAEGWWWWHRGAAINNPSHIGAAVRLTLNGQSDGGCRTRCRHLLETVLEESVNGFGNTRDGEGSREKRRGCLRRGRGRDVGLCGHSGSEAASHSPVEGGDEHHE